MQAIPNEAANTDRTEGRKKRRPSVTFRDEIVFDDGTRVLVVRLLDQGDGRSVYLARDVRDDKQLYALKRVDCWNEREVEQCRREVAVHRQFRHANIMPLLEAKFAQTPEANQTYFMLFPYLPRSLSDEIGARRLLEDCLEEKRRPFSTQQALTIFAGVARAVEALHSAKLSHRDIRPENVLLQKNKEKQPKKRKKKRRDDLGIPVLTDFGSVGPLTIPLSSPADIAKVLEDVESYTSTAYRAPELFYEEHTLSSGKVKSDTLDFGATDVWALGCLLFAILYGLSPFEMEWRVSLVEGAEADGTVQYVGASYERVVEEIPFLPHGSAAGRRYGEDVTGLVRWMLKKDPEERPSVGEILERVETLLDN